MLALTLGITASALAQVSQSPNYQLDGLGLGTTGGGTCSVDGIAYSTVGEVSGGTFSATNSMAGVGFLESFDPDLPAGLVIFSITPNFGGTAGGTPVVVSGLNFDKFGSGPTMQVLVGGEPATDVQVLSNTLATFTTPPGLVGERPVEMVNSFGSVTDPTGFIYTPAITTSPTVMLGGTLNITNYGSLGDMYTTFVSTSTTSILAKPYGTLLIGPVPFLQLIPPTPYPGPLGVDSIDIFVPVAPILSGLVVHFQSLSIFASGFPPGKLTNASTTAIL